MIVQLATHDGGEPLMRALSCMTEALELLDAADTPADIGAHLDLAIERLRVVAANVAQFPA
jgi:hypothetical protein